MAHRSVRIQALGLAAWLAATLLTGAIGAIASIDAAAFYARLNKPDWAPPATVFGPVWSTLFVLMGIAAWLAWREPPTPQRARALALFAAQLGVNALWSWLFFAWHRGGLAFADVLLLVVLIAATAAGFWRVSRMAALLLLPYLLWVAFASALTWSVWQANPLLLG